MKPAPISLGAATSALVFLFTALALAQLEIQTSVSAQSVEVGGSITLQGKGMSRGNTPSQPRLKTPSGVSVRGPSVSTSRSMTFGTGGMQSLRSITAAWQVSFSKTGSYKLGPISMLDGSKRVSGQSVTIKVVPKGALPQATRRRRKRRSPFDNSLFARRSSIFDDLLREMEPEQPKAPPEYQIDDAPHDHAFLRALAVPRTVVVGQQVTLRMFAYSSQGRFGLGVGHEARHPDFYAHQLPRPQQPTWYQVMIDSERFDAVELRAHALFPMKAGKLQISPMSMELRAPRLRASKNGFVAKSEALTITVVEPPAKGRPPGYRLGDVGDYKLTVTVTPREVVAGDSISITAHLEGTGNIPTQLITPDQKGVEWLTPTMREDLRLVAGDLIGGSRTFIYVVKLTEPGTIKLGKISLPYYSATRRRYRIARARLGNIEVKDNPAANKAAQENDVAPERKLSHLLAPRPLSSRSPELTLPLSQAPWFWPALLGTPSALIVVQLTGRRLSTWLKRRRRQRTSLSQLSDNSLTAAEGSAKSGDLEATASHIEKSLILAIEAQTGIKARAILKQELAGTLIKAEVPLDTASALTELLSECEASGFGGGTRAPLELYDDAMKLLKELSSLKLQGNAAVGETS